MFNMVRLSLLRQYMYMANIISSKMFCQIFRSNYFLKIIKVNEHEVKNITYLYIFIIYSYFVDFLISCACVCPHVCVCLSRVYADAL